MTAGGRVYSALSAEGLIDCQLAGELLRAGQYEQVVTVLCAAQTRCAEAGDGLTAHILEMATHLALACKQCREDAAWHRQAHREAERRELGLRNQLHTALNLIGKGQTSSLVPETEFFSSVSFTTGELSVPARKGAVGSRLWQHILTLVGQKRPREATLPAGTGVWRAETDQVSLEPTTVSGAPSSEELQSEPNPLDPSEQGVPAAPNPCSAALDESSDPSLTMYCLGHFQVYQDDQPIAKLTSNKSKSILKYLVTHRQSPVPKEVLMELFWPDVAPDAARNNLNVAIYGLRQALRRTFPSFSHVLFRDDCYLLNPELSIWVDCEAFEGHVAAALALQRDGDLKGGIREYRVAEELYQGDFMAGDRYEDWPSFQRQRLQTKYLELLQELSRYYLRRRDYATCATMCNKMLVVDPCHEQAHRRLMRCYSRQEQPYLAMRQYHLCVERLREELDASPTQETEALYREIRQGNPV